MHKLVTHDVKATLLWDIAQSATNRPISIVISDDDFINININNMQTRNTAKNRSKHLNSQI